MAIPQELLGRVIFLDTETAILGDHVCEIGVSVFYNGKLHGEWGSLVKPSIPIDPVAAGIHHINDIDVLNAPTFAQVAQQLLNFLSFAGIHGAYNLQYDWDVLGKEFARIGLVMPKKPVVDPLILFKKYYREAKFGKAKLVDMAEKFGFTYLGAHRAVNDATMCGRLLFRVAEVTPTFPKNMTDFTKKQRQWLEEQFTDFKNYRIKSGKPIPTDPKYSFYDPIGV